MSTLLQLNRPEPVLRHGVDTIDPSPFRRPTVLPRFVAIPAMAALAVGTLLASPHNTVAQTREPGFTVEQVLAPAFPYDLTSAQDTDRIAWMETEQGVRNVFTAAAPDFAPTRLTSSVVDDGVDIGPLQLSDDGSVLTFIRGHTRNDDGTVANPASDPLGGRREIWAVSTSGNRAPWRVVAADDMHLSPDGRWVLYTKDGRIHRAAVDPGIADAPSVDDAPPLLRDFGVHSDPVWSPDGKKVAFVSSRYDQRRPFPRQGRAATHTFITVYDVDSRRISYMAPSVDRDSSPIWSPDGRRIAFIRRPGLPFGHFASAPPDLPREQIPAGLLEAEFQGGYTASIWVADAETGEGRELWHNAPGDSLFAEASDLRWVGDHVLFEAEPEGWPHWFSVPVTGADAGSSGARPAADAVLLTPGEGMVEHVAPSADGRWLYYTSNRGEPERRDLWRVPVGGGAAERLTRGSGIETFPAVLSSGRQVALLQAGPRKPVSVALVPSNGGEARIIAPELPADFPANRHVEPETVAITAADGVTAHSILFLPPDLQPGERRPALVFIHGGPSMQTLLGYHHHDGSRGFYQMTYGMSQYFANKGYIVLSVNYRAGTGYGRAFRLAPERRDQGNSEYRDILAAGLWLRDRPDVDRQRIGVWGLSYGGWLTGQALSRNSDVFKAGMIFAGVQMRSASLDPDDLAYQSSPAYNIERWSSPVLVVHGDDDRNVEFSQTVGLVQLLRAHDIPHEVIVYPNETHYYQLFSRWVRTFNAIDDFFDRTLIRR
ncbi:MAG: prolyl oligopeptidase family serine peptidase [Gemmatimonadota bacterium]|nr:prolyl oligopeptidase family serine peptidase [Gemmatimonadota bacterium]